MKKFWNWVTNEGERVLRLDGPIDTEDSWQDGITPAVFRGELEADEGDVTVYVNSPGGSVFASSEIYTMLCEHKGKVTVKIDAIAASAASVVAMAGDRVLMSPTALLMMHDPATIAMGNAKDMEKAIDTLNEVKESIINAYVRKSGLSRNKVAKLMSDETWLNARKAVELGFADEIMFVKPAADAEKPDEPESSVEASWQPYSTKIMDETILNRFVPDEAATTSPDAVPEISTPEIVDMAPEASAEDPALVEQVDSADSTPVEDSAADPAPVEDSTADDEPQDVPVAIGLDGKTEDGSMPFNLLLDKLEYMR